MKKFLVALVAMFCVTAVSAQVNNVGIRFNGGVEVVGQYDLSKANHIEGRLGFGGGWVSLSGLYNWHLKDFNWTPNLGKWFFDAGVGANLGTGSGFTTIAAIGTAQLGIKFNDAPVSVTFDLEPTLNLVGGVGFGVGSGVSIVYHF
ncbi:MAG: hypothetical protein J6U93_05070 [Alistipes sp.]|nr:hypothetical protein [Alistipes sp.]MBO7263874.1 hypothetical protein [Alistipes sp.]